MLNIVLFGPPGAGKGTQSALLVQNYHLIHLSTGDILRAEIAACTKLGLEAKGLMDEGRLVPDDVVIGMIRCKLENAPDAPGYIFDGFPRTIPQAEALDKLLNELGTKINVMLALEVDEEELTRRLLNRGKESGRSDDTNEDIIRNRIREYNQKTAPLAGYYTAQGKYTGIPGIGEIETISALIKSAVEKHN
mgnify:CR=1 FL=1